MAKAPNIPTGPRAGSKPVSKPMKPMPAASPTKPGAGKPDGSSNVSPTKQGQTADGGPKK
jgi:hypothetical protein